MLKNNNVSTLQTVDSGPYNIFFTQSKNKLIKFGVKQFLNYSKCSFKPAMSSIIIGMFLINIITISSIFLCI